MLRYHLDENVEWALADGLRRHRLDVTSTPPDLPKGTPDPDQLAYTFAEQRVVVTRDDDLLGLSSAGSLHAGIAYYRPRTRTIGQLVATLVALSKRYTAEQMKGRVEYL